MKSQTSIIVADIEAKTKHTLATLDARMKAIETMWDKLQESEGAGGNHSLTAVS